LVIWIYLRNYGFYLLSHGFGTYVYTIRIILSAVESYTYCPV
jgi:hypothetical protein